MPRYSLNMRSPCLRSILDARGCITDLLPLLQALSRLSAGERARDIRVQISMQSAAVRNALSFEQARPELALLPFLIQKHLNREAHALARPLSQVSVRPSSATRCATGPYAVPLGKVYVTGGGALASTQPWDQEQLTIESVKANPNIRGEPYYDFVSVVREMRLGSAGCGDRSWYAQLRCLFTYELDTGPLPQKLMLLALVRWMVSAHTLVSDRLLTESGSKCLKWAQAPASHPMLTLSLEEKPSFQTCGSIEEQL